jgi:hypothetical protein
MEHGGAGEGFLHALEMSAVGEAMRQSLVLYPVVETLHIVGFSILIGSIIAFDLRVLGFGRAVPLEAAARHLLPVSWIGFAIAVPMGLLLFTTEATSIAENPSFLVKMSLIILAGLNMAIFHFGSWRSVSLWANGPVPGAARAGALASMVLWLGVLAGGRLIAYF